MEEENEKKKSKLKKFLKKWIISILMLIGFTMFALVTYHYQKRFPNFLNSYDAESLGVFGDFFGGTLNPIFAFFSFALLLLTIRLQLKELKNSRKELKESRKATRDSATALQEQSNSIKIQNFENTFFNMINLHNEITRNIKLDNKLEFQYSTNKRETNYQHLNLIKIYGYSLSVESHAIEYSEARAAINFITEIIDSFSLKAYYIRFFTIIYDLCHDASQIYLGHYFGNIYQILKFISTNENIENKRKYSDLFRAQFSSAELKLLFYHCTGKIGSKRFKNYIEEFEFFEHLVLEESNENFKFILSSKIYNDSAFGNNKEIKNFIEDSIKENEFWLESYVGLEDEEKNLIMNINAVKIYSQKKYFKSAYDILDKLIESEDKNYIRIFINDLKELEKRIINTSSQDQQ